MDTLLVMIPFVAGSETLIRVRAMFVGANIGPEIS
jgi:hypothetical protein